jgi:hypothetical protein
VLGTEGIIEATVEPLADIRFVTYPNPANQFLNVLLRLENPADLSLELFNGESKMIASKPLKIGVSGEFSEQFDLHGLPAGTYSVVLTVGGRKVVRQVVKQ